MAPRPVLIHYHIFKNGGSSVDRALRQNFGDAWTPFEGEGHHDVLPADKLRAFLLSRPDVLAVSSHLARPPLPWPGSVPLVFLRHPILRARSVYDFTARDPSQPYHDVARRSGFADYIRWALDGNGNGVVIRDYQVIHLSRASFCNDGILHARATEGDLTEARNTLESWGSAGLVERYGESLQRFEARAKVGFGRLSLTAYHENAAPRPALSMEAQLQAIWDDLGPDLSDDLMRCNALDLRLYQWASHMFDNHWAESSSTGGPPAA